MMDDDLRLELAWAAGLFDGEGSTYLDRTRWTVCMSLGQRHPGVVNRFHEAVKIGRVNGGLPPKLPSTKPKWQWSCKTRGQAEEVMAKLWPYLSEVKRSQYLDALITRDTFS